jgi:hypothetical protein
MLSRWKVICTLIMAVGVTGCSKGPPPGAPIGTPSPVRGKITFPDGEPLCGGVVIFQPVEVNVGSKLRFDSASVVDEKGAFTLGRNGDGKGAVPGEYIVTVEPREVGELPNSNSNSIPEQFRSKKTSPLKFTVGETDNTINIVLK